jgi:hypothetical protein
MKKKRVFTPDYELSYKNNNQPDAATLIIHGKGRFKSILTFAFYIN